MRHVFIISTEAPDAFRRYDVATCGEVEARSLKGCAARDLARLLVGNGVPDGPIEARAVDGKLRYTVRSLHAFARKWNDGKWWKEYPGCASGYGQFRAVELARGIGLPKNRKGAIEANRAVAEVVA